MAGEPPPWFNTLSSWDAPLPSPVLLKANVKADGATVRTGVAGGGASTRTSTATVCVPGLVCVEVTVIVPV